jgi:Uncharacterised nucleotidyltransferase
MDLLFRLLSGTSRAGDVAADQWPALLEAANAHSVAALLAQRVLTEPLPDDVRTTLTALQERTARRNVARLRDFAIVATALAQRGIPVIALKGTHLTALVYRSLAARGMADIDILVPSADLAGARNTMRALGYDGVGRFRGAEMLPFTGHHLPTFVKPGATTVEVHWDLCDPGTPVIDVDGLWARAMPARIGGVDTRVLAAEDLLLHLAAHATYSDECEISTRACCDIAEVVRTYPMSWETVADRARQWNITRGTYLVLRLARDVFATPVPAGTLAALEPPGFDDRLLRIAMRGKFDRNPAGPLRYTSGLAGKLRALKTMVLPDLDVLADYYGAKRSYRLYLRRAANIAGRWREVIDVYRNGRAEAESAAMETFLHGAPK